LNNVEPVTEGELKSIYVGGGCQIKRLLAELDLQKGWSLPSVGFVSEQTVGGAISTGTHGCLGVGLTLLSIAAKWQELDPRPHGSICGIDFWSLT